MKNNTPRASRKGYAGRGSGRSDTTGVWKRNASGSVDNPITSKEEEGDQKEVAPPPLSDSSAAPPPDSDSDNNLSPPTTTYVTECATIYSVLMFCLSSSFTLLFAYYAHTGDGKASKFWPKITLPICLMAIGILFCLKPRRKYKKYKAFLILQFVLFSFVVKILTIVGNDPSKRLF